LAKTIEKNNRFLSSKADKLRYTYSFLIIWLVAFSTGIGFLITTPDWRSVVSVSLVSVLVMVVISSYILRKKYDGEAEGNDDGMTQ